MEKQKTKKSRQRLFRRSNIAINQAARVSVNNRKNKFRNSRTRLTNLDPYKTKYLIELFKKSPNSILLQVLEPKFQLEKILDQDLFNDSDYIIKFIFLIEKAFECNSLSTKLDVLMKHVVPSKLFQLHVINILNSSQEAFVESVINLCSIFLYLDSFNTSKLAPLRQKLCQVAKYYSSLKETYNQFEKFYQECEALNSKIRNQTFSNKEQSFHTNLDNFTQMNIVPKLDDILTDQTPFLRKNLASGSYQNVHHYLDVQYRLLREDFMLPLRNGVGNFRDIIKFYKIRNKKKDQLSRDVLRQLKQIDNLNIYFNVYMQSCIATYQGVVFCLKIDTSGMKILDPKRLIYGSLVCLSSDYFQTECLIGIIKDKDPEFKNNNLIYVNFCHNYLDVAERSNLPKANACYVMLESSVYFESYKHVLKALCAFGRDGEFKFPFREHLIYGESLNVRPPNYLKNANLDFRPLLDDPILTTSFDGNKINQFDERYSRFSGVNLNHEHLWPSADLMKFNKKQYDALKLSLKNRLTLIQGPPGTGKTYVGVKIVKLLLHNRNLWWNLEDDRRRPILMVCYTNHALDQFLEFCIKECNLTEGIVRVGGRSRSSFLEPFLLSNIKQKFRNENKSNRFVKHLIGLESKKLDGLRKSIDYEYESTNAILSHTAILRFNVLKDIFAENHRQQIINLSDRDFFHNDLNEDFCLLEWLGFFQQNLNVSAGQSEEKNTEEEEEKKQDEEEGEEKEKEIDESDNESIQNERILESDLKFENLKKNFNNQNKYILNLDNILKMIEAYNLIKGFEKKVDKIQIQNLIKTRTTECLKFSDEDFLILQNIPNIWMINYEQRFLLYSKYLLTFLNQKQEKIENLINKYNQSASILEELRLNEDKEIMEQALIVAMTTTGSTRYHSILKDIGPRIVIVEEAAEVFEAHIVGSLSQHCEHLILIGDHVQLRPNPAVYNLAKIYKLDVSLFERLVNNNFKRVMLNSQHRMRPDISNLMKYFYEEPIENHSSVASYPHVLGLTKNIFFIEHKNLEDSSRKLRTSKTNIYEINYVVKLVNYLVKSAHLEEDITILSMYLGQTMIIKKKLKEKCLNKIKISTVDNYQGEENKIIILSLVRSNKENKIGFVNIPNRVCVALSRAKHGLYVIGNFDFICLNETNNKWKQIVKELKESENVGKLTLTCTLHPKNDVEVRDLANFDNRINCCCNSTCGILLKCGHLCPKKCHITSDITHENHKCMQKCGKKLNCLHLCKQICSKHIICGICDLKIEKIIPDCGHLLKNVRCDSRPTRKDCVSLCNKKMSCGHLCTQICNKHTECTTCPLNVDKIIPDCGHLLKNVRCDISPKRKDCVSLCNKKMSCGHLCNLNCSDHLLCKTCPIIVTKTISECGHKIDFRCDIRPTRKDCVSLCNKKMSCGHLCTQICNKHTECTTCPLNVDKIIPDCGHLLKNVRCDSRPTRKNCVSLCNKKMSCGHLCTQICNKHTECTTCPLNVDKIIPDCGHLLKNVRCDSRPTRKDCISLCDKTLSCGHLCTKNCSILDCGNCEYIVDVKSICNHPNLVQSKCSDKFWNYQLCCKRPCFQNLKCGHLCESLCGQCCGGYIHSICSKNVQFSFNCGHKKIFKCYEQKSICMEECKTFCPHGKCKHPCGWPCDECLQPCEYKCEHLSCTKKCGEFCDRPMCDQPCQKKLPCGHQCIGFCGEPCPTVCRICNHTDFAKISLNCDHGSKFVLLTDCGHIFESAFLDEFIREKSLQCSEQLVACPQCNSPIRHNYRYGNFLKAQKIEIERIKYSQIGNQRANEIAKNNLLKSIENHKNPFIQNINALFYSNLNKINYFTDSIIQSFFSTWDILLKLNSLNDILQMKNYENNQKEHILFEINKLRDLFVLKDKNGNCQLNTFQSNQMFSDFLCEIKRINSIFRLYDLKNELKNFNSKNLENINREIEKIESKLFKTVQKFDNSNEDYIELEFNKITSALNVLRKKEKCSIS